MDIRKPVLGILVTGRTSPGINTAISSCVIEAINRNQDVIGFLSGWSYLKEGASSHVMRLKISLVSYIHNLGGLLLKTTKSELETPSHYKNALCVLKHFGVTNLICIGWTQSALSLLNLEKLAREVGYPLKTCMIPTSIFNDTPLPPHCSTFGFSTAQHFGSQLITNYYKDARANDRWYVVRVVGSKAGHLCLAIGRNASATLMLVQEEFEDGVTFDEVLDHIEMSIVKRSAMGKEYGICLLSEGIVDKMQLSEVKALFGSIENGRSSLAKTVCDKIAARAERRAKPLPLLAPQSVGFEVRCTDPDTTDHDMARNLGYGAAHLLLSKGLSGQAVAQKTDFLVSFPMGTLLGFESAEKCKEIVFDSKESFGSDLRGKVSAPVSIQGVGFELEYDAKLLEKVKWRQVRKNSLNYIVASEYMIRLKKEDLKDEKLVFLMAQKVGLSVGSFLKRYGYVAIEPY